jgi:Tol biopolymer transport system component
MRGAAAIVAALGALTLAVASPAAASLYSEAPYTVTNHSYTFGQAPVFMPDGRIVVGKDFKDGAGTQVYLSNFDGSGRACLTCDMPAPNNVPNVRPQGDWILFHSWNGHHLTVGSPGYGGMGSELWAMRPDGSGKVQLTGTDAAHGAGEGEDDYHAYWSPDGRQLVWAHLNWNFITDGGDGNWDVRVADFVDDGVHPPHLANTRVVRPANGHWYETQWWAPDGSGFLYTETAGTAMNTELFFCRLTASGCEARHLTDFDVGWDEQAIFTPDGQDVIFMSSRDHPGFYNTWVTLTQDANLTTSLDYLLVLPIFEAAFLQPVAQEATDLYDLDLTTGAVRRLTTSGDDGWIVPEFTWDPTNSFLFWTEQRIVDRERVPLPLKPFKQVARAIELAKNPPLPESGLDNLLSAAIKIEARTRILRFDLP